MILPKVVKKCDKNSEIIDLELKVSEIHEILDTWKVTSVSEDPDVLQAP